jgi:Acetyltransferases, including N-acetylases of ribosomal proteins
LGSDAKRWNEISWINLSLENFKRDATAEIGFELLPENHGKGIMQEVIPRVIQFGFEEMKLETIEAEVSPRNLKSVRLLEKNNFTLAAVNEENPDSVVYALKRTKS